MKNEISLPDLKPTIDGKLKREIEELQKLNQDEGKENNFDIIQSKSAYKFYIKYLQLPKYKHLMSFYRLSYSCIVCVLQAASFLSKNLVGPPNPGVMQRILKTAVESFIPYGGLVTEVVSGIAEAFEKKYLDPLRFLALEDVQTVVEMTAIELCVQYEEQISTLSTEGIETLGQALQLALLQHLKTNRIVEFSEENRLMEMRNYLIAATTQCKHKGTFFTTRVKTKFTTTYKDWSTNGIFKEPGLKLLTFDAQGRISYILYLPKNYSQTSSGIRCSKYGFRMITDKNMIESIGKDLGVEFEVYPQLVQCPEDKNIEPKGPQKSFIESYWENENCAERKKFENNWQPEIAETCALLKNNIRPNSDSGPVQQLNSDNKCLTPPSLLPPNENVTQPNFAQQIVLNDILTAALEAMESKQELPKLELEHKADANKSTSSTQNVTSNTLIIDPQNNLGNPSHEENKINMPFQVTLFPATCYLSSSSSSSSSSNAEVLVLENNVEDDGAFLDEEKNLNLENKTVELELKNTFSPAQESTPQETWDAKYYNCLVNAFKVGDSKACQVLFGTNYYQVKRKYQCMVRELLPILLKNTDKYKLLKILKIWIGDFFKKMPVMLSTEGYEAKLLKIKENLIQYLYNMTA